MDTLKQQKRKEKIKELLDKGSVAFIKHLFEIEETIDELDKKIKPLSESQMEMVSRIVESVVDHVRLKDKGDKGEDGEDYILTDEDKEEIVEDLIENIELPLDEIAKKVSLEDIAKLVKVPVIEKVIEKTEVIKEVPIITNEVKEVAVTETGEKIVEKINDLPIEREFQIGKEHIRDLENEISELKSAISNIPRGGGSARRTVIRAYSLTSQCNGVTKTFTLPSKTVGVVGVFGTQFPVNYEPNDDWTFSGKTLTLGSSVGAPETGQTLWVLLERLGSI